MLKLIAMGLTGLVTVGLNGLTQDPPPPPRGEAPPPPKAREKAKPEAPGDEIRKTYDLLRHLRGDPGDGQPEGRVRDWTERATDLYRQAIHAASEGDDHRARELGTASHDLARAIDHARNAARLDRPDPALPPPPERDGPEDLGGRTRRDLQHAYDRIRTAGPFAPEADARFYLDAARDLYNAARRDVEAGRDERGGELARAAEAMTHVPEHLGRAREEGPARPPAPEPRKGAPPDEFGPPPDPKAAPGAAPGPELPPPLDR